MAFDKPTRNKLARMVAECRRLLTDDIRDQLQAVYGIQPDGTALAVDKLAHLDDRGLETAVALRQWLGHLAVSETGSGIERRQKSFFRMAHETAFTYLNRLAALRMCEQREHVIECVRHGMESDGFAMYERLAGQALGDRGETYRVFLECMFDELAVDLGVLFDRRAAHSLVFPRPACIEAVLAELNDAELLHLWKEDETIGWVYQYFNSKEEREAMRKASQAPRNSRELAVRNQFFTPRYVVEFLTDNTLGRIWYEMRKGDSQLKEDCRYLVRRPSEVFLAAGEEPPPPNENDEDLPQEELLKRPVHIPHLPKKDPRDLKILDPACGSGHFLLYAFDLLETIYIEAFQAEHSPASEATGNPLCEDYPSEEELRKAIPVLVLHHNLHGIDIDPRATQIAALALWLRAQRSYQKLGLKPADRRQITKSNIVCAEPMPGEDDLLKEFTATLNPPVLGQLVETIFDKMKLAGEAGSLLKIEEEIRQAVADAKQQWKGQFERARDKRGQEMLFTVADMHGLSKDGQRQLDFSEVTDESFWQQAEGSIVDALRSYAERSMNGHTFRRGLFADDAAEGFAFVDVCRQRYEVVLMNPPFGDPPEGVDLKSSFPGFCGNVLEAFAHRACEFGSSRARIGSVIDATVLIKNSYEKFRKRVSVDSGRLRFCSWLGWEVLDDANVEVGLVIFETGRALTSFDSLNAKAGAEEMLAKYSTGSGRESLTQSGNLVRATSELLEWIPNLSFPLTSDVRVHIGSQKLSNGFAQAKQGVAPIDSFRVMRLRCEVPPGAIGAEAKWWNVNRGGAYCPFYRDYKDVVNWEDSGKELKEEILKRYPYLDGNVAWVAKNEECYGKAGLGYGKRTDFLSCQVLPRDTIITVEGFGVFPVDDPWLVLGILNSRYVSHILNTFCGQHKYSGYVDKIPVPELTDAERSTIASSAESGFTCVRSLESRSLLSPLFVVPKLAGSSLVELRNNWTQEWKRNVAEVERLLCQIDDIFARYWPSVQPVIVRRYDPEKGLLAGGALLDLLVGFVFGRWDIRLATGKKMQPCPPPPFDMLPQRPPGSLAVTSSEDVQMQEDYPVELPSDGILVDDPGLDGTRPHKADIVNRIRNVLRAVWGAEGGENETEYEVARLFKAERLRDCFRRPGLFFGDHLNRHTVSRRKAPMYLPLSTSSGSYTIWLYYQRLSDQTLHTIINHFLEPKIADVRRAASRVEGELTDASGAKATELRDKLNGLKTFDGELEKMKQELLRVTALPYKPDRNDGVIISAAPLYKLFQHRSWAKECEKVWKKLEKGEYDWSHMAYNIWPDRVREKCRKDRSRAIAHGLEDICDVPPPGEKKKRSRAKKG